MINQSEYFVHATKDGVTQSFGPGADIPDWVKIDNPFVTGKDADVDTPSGDDAEAEEKPPPKRRPRKAASS